ncbi:uncharacterized protein LOC103569155 [Caerostris extrusa]|uniref:Uncharacterized protein LOC103569155, partial n=1 Tax=Caerostris extrusa TaxID=172846 RepID=A0AAV4TY04_CAEEX|nr:uncharacterized protein LOC103569155 [Caerostris extrusa]
MPSTSRGTVSSTSKTIPLVQMDMDVNWLVALFPDLCPCHRLVLLSVKGDAIVGHGPLKNHSIVSRFAVKFPFRESSDELGSSRDIAIHRLHQIERRFAKNPSLFSEYHKFMEDYLKLVHMELIPENEIDVPANSSFYLPHHPVPNKSGDKFRVVFDGSAKSSTGVSLNDKLMNSLASPFKPIQDFRLTRIAYGTASAPYLAVKCLQQLAIQEEQNFPLASKAALKDFYVDDLMSGANSTTKALDLQAQLIQMLSSAGLVLRKWASNCNELTNLIQEDLRLPNASLSIDDGTVKTLDMSRKHSTELLELDLLKGLIATANTFVGQNL